MIACIALFAAMITAVVVLGVESEAKGAAEAPTTTASSAARTVAISETEFKITLPSTTLTLGKYTFVVKNAGGLAHDLVFEGPNVSGREGTPLIQPGGTAKVTVSLAKGRLQVYCSVDGHRAAGMVREDHPSPEPATISKRGKPAEGGRSGLVERYRRGR